MTKMNEPGGIIVHCSDSPHGRGDDVETIRRWHKERGFDDIGYHYVILEDGTVQDGRSLEYEGAHARGYNEFVGICLIGETYFSPQQFTALKRLMFDIINKNTFPMGNVMGHNQVSDKLCPNFDVRDKFKLDELMQ